MVEIFNLSDGEIITVKGPDVNFAPQSYESYVEKLREFYPEWCNPFSRRKEG